MLLSLVFFFVLVISGDASDVTRDFFGDIFRMRDCHNGSRCDNGGRRAALQVPGRPCYCQCAPTHLTYREDKQQCVKVIKECYMSVFYRPFTVEAIPLVYLPTSGQLVHPDAHLSLSMRRNFEGGMAKCRVTLSQYLTREGWRTLTKLDGTGGSVFGLFTDSNKTYLQFLGNSHDRKLLQQNLALVRLLCIIPQYPAFETCVAIRIGWVPGVENLEDMPTSSNKANMMVVGLSLGVLALVYIFAVLVYLKIRRQMIAKQKENTDQEAKLQSLEENSDKASNLHRLEASSRLELYHSASMGRQKYHKNGYRNNCDPWNQMSPIVETYNRTWTDRMGQHSSEFRAQDFKLQPEFFEPEFMASPPHEVLEYLERLQNSVTFARHRMRSCYRYQPTLNGIPEDDYFYQELENKDSQNKEIRTTPDGGSASSVGSVQDSPDQTNDLQKRELPKIPPRKPKRKFAKNKSESSAESAQSSDQEQKEIQKAMNTLNDTLEALEYDIYKQEILNQASDSETANLSCQNSTSIDFDDFETSSCSSMSAITIMGRDAKRLSDISKCSQFVEKNQSEEFSTFSNSTYSMSEAMRGLFHDGNKATEPGKSNASSRCSSRAGFMAQTEETYNTGREKDRRMNIKKEINKTDDSAERAGSRNDHLYERQKCTDNTNNFSLERNSNTPTRQENSRTPSQDHGLKNIQQGSIHRNINTPNRDRGMKNFSFPFNECMLKNSTIMNTKENCFSNVVTPEAVEMRENTFSSKTENWQRNCVTPNPEEIRHNMATPNKQENMNKNGSTSYTDNNHRSLNSSREELRHRSNNTPSFQEQRSISSPNREKQSENVCSPSEEHRHNSPSSQDQRNISTPNQENPLRNTSPPGELRNTNSKIPRFQEREQRNVSTPNIENRPRNISSPSEEHRYRKDNTSSFQEKEHRSTGIPKSENYRRNTNSPSEEPKQRNNTPNFAEKEQINISTPSSQENSHNNTSDSEDPPLQKSPSTESMTTVATDMTSDSLDSRCSSPSHPSPTPSLMEMWINKLVSTSASKNRRKSKKKLILPEDEVESWEHVCQKHKDPCPMHDLNDSEPNLIDKLAHYSSKTMAGCDVAGYFQSLKQDVLKEHLKTWLSSNNQSKRHKKGISLNYSNECSHKKPLVNGQESNVVDENGMHLSSSTHSRSCSVETLSDNGHRGEDLSIIDDSLEPDSTAVLQANSNIYFEKLKETCEKTVET